MKAKWRWVGLVRASALMVGVGAVVVDQRATAQGLTPDPYNIVGEYNGQYAPYMYAVQPSADSMFPNKSRLQERAGYRSANRFQSFMDEGEGGDASLDLPSPLGRRAGLGNPYYSAFRRYDSDFGRVYRPNEAVDRAYYSGLNDRNSRYFDAMKEQDPRKRAQLLREYNIEKLRAARDLSTNRNGPERDLERPAPGPATRRAPGLEGLPQLRRPATGTASRREGAPAPSSSTGAAPSRSARVIGPVEPRPSASSRNATRRGAPSDGPAGTSPSEILRRSERIRRGEPIGPVEPRPTREVAPPPR